MQMVSNHPGDVDMITKSLNEISEDFAAHDIKEKSAPTLFQGLNSHPKHRATLLPAQAALTPVPATFSISHPSKTFGAG